MGSLRFNMKEKGIIFGIQRFSINDGPGIRTLVFLKGCNLRCQWCSNPEGQRFKPDLFFQPEKCIGCQACIKVCPERAIGIKKGQIFFQRELCKNCGKCTEVCYAEARVMKGKEMSVDEVIKEIIKDSAFYTRSQGGVTLGGGEPLLQVDFAVLILKKCKKRGLNTAIETAGHVPWENIEKVIPYTDLFLYDVKHMDPKIHEQYTGVNNKLILLNLEKLVKKGVLIIVRTPVIPGFNDTEADISDIAQHVAKFGIKEYDLLPYHGYGKNKYNLLGRDYPFKNDKILNEKEVEKLKIVALKQGLKVKIDG